jgi:DNA modification methylase
LFASKGDKPINSPYYRDVLHFPLERQRLHPAQKPAALYSFLASKSVVPGMSILDPFCGTGPVFDAARDARCRAWGFDSDPTALQLSRERIERIVKGGTP